MIEIRPASAEGASVLLQGLGQRAIVQGIQGFLQLKGRSAVELRRYAQSETKPERQALGSGRLLTGVAPAVAPIYAEFVVSESSGSEVERIEQALISQVKGHRPSSALAESFANALVANNLAVVVEGIEIVRGATHAAVAVPGLKPEEPTLSAWDWSWWGWAAIAAAVLVLLLFCCAFLCKKARPRKATRALSKEGSETPRPPFFYEEPAHVTLIVPPVVQPQLVYASPTPSYLPASANGTFVGLQPMPTSYLTPTSYVAHPTAMYSPLR